MGEPRAISLQFLHKQVQAAVCIASWTRGSQLEAIDVHDVEQSLSSLYMLQESVAHANVVMGTFHQAGQVCQSQRVAVTPGDGPQLGLDGRDWK